MGNAGEARLDVVAQGRDEVTAVMNKVSGELDQLKSKLAAYEKAQRGTTEASKESTNVISGLTAKMAALKESAAPVNKVREAFENLKSNAGFALGAIGGLVGGLISGLSDLVLSLSDNAQAIEKWTQVSANMEAGLKKSRDLIADVNRLLGEAPPTAMETMLGRMHDRLTEVAEAIAIGEKGIAAFKDQLERATAFAPVMGIATSEAYQSIRDEQEKLNKLKADQLKLDAKNVELAEEQAQLTREQVALILWLRGTPQSTKKDEKAVDVANPFSGESADVEMRNMQAAFIKAFNDATKGKGGGRGARAQTTQEGIDAVLGTGKWAEKEANPALGNLVEAGLAEMSGIDAFIARLNARVAESAKLREEAAGKVKITLLDDKIADEEAERINKITDAISRLGETVGEVSPELGAMFERLASTWSGIGSQWDSIKDKSKALAGGVVGSVDAIATASAAWFKDEKERTRFLAAKEALLAIPLWFIDPAQAAAKTAASIGLFALAGGGGGARGGGGGGARAAGGGSLSGGNASSGGGVQVNNIHNYQMGFGDRQTMIDAQRQGERRARGTGIGASVGV